MASLEKKIDTITSILVNDSISRLNPCVNVHDETQLCSNNVVDDSSSTLSLESGGMSKSFNNDISINNEPLDNDRLIHIHHQANSSANFAVRLVSLILLETVKLEMLSLHVDPFVAEQADSQRKKEKFFPFMEIILLV